MEEKQIAEIDARIAPIFRAADAYVGFVQLKTDKKYKEISKVTYIIIYNFASNIIRNFGIGSYVNLYLVSLIKQKVDKTTNPLDVMEIHNILLRENPTTTLDFGEVCLLLDMGEKLSVSGSDTEDATIMQCFHDSFLSLANLLLFEYDSKPAMARRLLHQLRTALQKSNVEAAAKKLLPIGQPHYVAIAQATHTQASAGKTLDELLTELDGLIGLDSVKREVRSLVNLMRVRELRRERGLPSPEVTLHLVFTGNPGTGPCV